MQTVLRYSFILSLTILINNLSAQIEKSESAGEKLSSIINQYENLDNSDQDKDTKSSWPALDAESLEERKQHLQSLKSSLAAINPEKLDQNKLVNRDLLSLIVDNELSEMAYESYLFPINSEGGFLTDILYSIRGKSVTSDEEFADYEQLITSLPAYIALRTSHLEAGISANKMMPALIVKNTMKNIEGILKAGPSSSFYLDPLMGDKSRESSIELLLKKLVFPAYQSLYDFLEQEYLPKAPTVIGVSQMENGKSYYEERVRYYTTFDISPQEVFDTGMSEVKRIRSEMEAIIKDLAFDGDFDDFLSFLRNDKQFYAESADELLKEAAWITKRMEGMLPKYFNTLPRMPLTVTPVPEALAPNYTAGRYSPGSYKNTKPGEYWVNTYDLPSRPLYSLPALSLHEGVPGHHTQIMLSSEMENVPTFRQQMYLSAFGEGWALYTEFLGKEAGIYDTPYKEFGRLTYEMWRACRLVVDPGMHYFGWTREEAVKFMAENTALSFREVNSEIDRYIGWPAQAVSYKMGELKIRELRKKAEFALADRFDIRAFHDLVLSQGSVPMATLEKMVDEFIASN